MSDLEIHREHVEQVLRWHRERHWPVAAQIRHYLPEFAGMTDRAVLDAEFTPNQARALVARRAGFDSWETFAASPTSPRATRESTPAAAATPGFGPAIPFLWASDIPRTCRFFAATLGFDVDFTYGEPPFYGEIFRDGVRFAVRQVDEAEIAAGRDYRHAEALPAATVMVARAEPLFFEFEGRGATFHQRLRTEAWGARSFIVEDPDGNLICFLEGA